MTKSTKHEARKSPSTLAAALAALLLLYSQLLDAQPMDMMYSPDGKTTVEFVAGPGNALLFNIRRGGHIIFENSELGFAVDGTKHCMLDADTMTATSDDSHARILRSDFGERKLQHDCHNVRTVQFVNGELHFAVEMRLYDHAFAVRYVVENSKFCDFVDQTRLCLRTGTKIDLYAEQRNERGYEKINSTNCKGICPIFFHNDSLYCIVNEAANHALATTASIKAEGGKFTFDQTYDRSKSIKSSFRYVIFAGNAIEMLENKFVINSLNMPGDTADNDYSYLKCGTVFRYIPRTGDSDFNTDEAKKVVDFCSEHKIKYMLLDAGWYGLGYKAEHQANSDPFKPVDRLDVKELTKYAKAMEVGIILYVNKVAWHRYDNARLLDTFALWGISGIKMGYLSSNNMRDMKKIYSVVQMAAERKMFVNVHDNVRPSGVETNLKNLLTAEGVRGNEYTDNTPRHTMLLPFTRFMTGPADYTICYPGYPPPNYKARPVTTKAHQLALSVILFSPLQHLMWYSMPYQYEEKPHEIDFFYDLPTVWDDYKILEAVPASHFSILRAKGDRWYYATATSSERLAKLGLGFLHKKKRYKARLFEDDGSNSIKTTEIEDLRKVDTLSFKLSSSSGATAIFERKSKHRHVINSVTTN